MHTSFASPMGLIYLTSSDGAALSGAYFAQQRHFPKALGDPASNALFREASEQLKAWFSGKLTVFDLPLAARGTPFQTQVWAQIEAIPYDQTISYGAIASALGQPSAARAVGAATGRNPLAIIVPCHRVQGASGALTGYAGGLDRKRALLALERTLTPS